VIKRSLIYGRIVFTLAVNILHKSHQVAWAAFFSYLRTALARARACVQEGAWLKHSVIFGQILFKFAGDILKMTPSYMGYILIRFTYSGLKLSGQNRISIH
jgi:hypothetical protein